MVESQTKVVTKEGRSTNMGDKKIRYTGNGCDILHAWKSIINNTINHNTLINKLKNFKNNGR